MISHSRLEILRELILAQPQGIIVPPIKFFLPRPSFVSWMKKEFADRLIYDVGAGCGHVSRALHKAGMRVEAFDLMVRKAEFPVAVANSVGFSYAHESVVMLCRPCHGPFIDATILQASKCGAYAIIYVGLQRNVEADILSYSPLFKLEKTGVGKDGEDAYVFRCLASPSAGGARK